MQVVPNIKLGKTISIKYLIKFDDWTEVFKIKSNKFIISVSKEFINIKHIPITEIIKNNLTTFLFLINNPYKHPKYDEPMNNENKTKITNKDIVALSVTKAIKQNTEVSKTLFKQINIMLLITKLFLLFWIKAKDLP